MERREGGRIVIYKEKGGPCGGPSFLGAVISGWSQKVKTSSFSPFKGMSKVHVGMQFLKVQEPEKGPTIGFIDTEQKIWLSKADGYTNDRLSE